MHKNDPGIYSVQYYDNLGRKVASVLTGNQEKDLQLLFNSYVEAVDAVSQWVNMDADNSAVILRCLYNSKVNNNKWD